jgi:hypothetical protein
VIFVNGVVNVWQLKQFAQGSINAEAYLTTGNALKFRAWRMKNDRALQVAWTVQYCTAQHSIR